MSLSVNMMRFKDGLGRLICRVVLGSGGCVLLLSAVAWADELAVSGWMMAGEQGGCADLSTIRTKTLDLLAWSSPEELINHLRARRELVGVAASKVSPGYMVKVVVPGRSIDVVFVPIEVCRILWEQSVRTGIFP